MSLGHDAVMTPDDLRRALSAAPGEAVSTCLLALDDPDAVVHADWVHPHHPSTANLLTIYRRRATHVEEIGLPTIGFRDVVERLEQTPHEALRLAGIEGANGYPWCVVFLSPTEPTVVAALAVLGPVPPI